MSTFTSGLLPINPPLGSLHLNTMNNQWGPTGSVLVAAGGTGQSLWTSITSSSSQTATNSYINSYPSNIIFSTNMEVVRINPDGSITWANGIEINEAAKAFSKSLTLGTEMIAGINTRVRGEIRDEVYAEVIDKLIENGKLTIEELTVMRDSKTVLEIMKED